MAYFPSSQITGIAKARFYAAPLDYKQITDSWEYEDGGKDFNEVAPATDAPRRWEYGFTGLTPAQAQIYDDFYASVRVSIPFNFTDKYGVTWSNVYVEDYERTHDDHKSWIVTVRFRLVGFGSVMTTPDTPTIVLISASLVGTDVQISGTLTETSGFADLQLYVNDAPSGSLTNTAAGAFTLSVPLADLIGGPNTFYAIAVNAQSGIDTSNTLTFEAVFDPYPPSVPVIYSVSGTLTSQMLVEWYPSSDEEAYGAGSEEDYYLLFS